MARKCDSQVANGKSQWGIQISIYIKAINSPKHLQEKGNLFLIRSVN